MRDLHKIKPKYTIELDDRQIIYLFSGSLVALLLTFSLGVMLGWNLKGLDKEDEFFRQISWRAAEALAPVIDAGSETKQAEAAVAEKREDAAQQPASLAKPQKEQEVSGASKADLQTSVPGGSQNQNLEVQVVQSFSKNTENFSEEAGEATDLLVEEQSVLAPAPALPAAASRPESKNIALPEHVLPPVKRDQLALMGKLYTVQIGAFRSVSEAVERVEALKKKGLSAYALVADIPGKGRWFRVRVGTFRDMQGAREFAKAIAKHEGIEAMVTPYTLSHE